MITSAMYYISLQDYIYMHVCSVDAYFFALHTERTTTSNTLFSMSLRGTNGELDQSSAAPLHKYKELYNIITQWVFKTTLELEYLTRSARALRRPRFRFLEVSLADRFPFDLDSNGILSFYFLSLTMHSIITSI